MGPFAHNFKEISLVIVIKKYPNRRLYDTSKSEYINFGSIREMLLTEQCFRIYDSKTGNDLTKSVLLQLVLEHEGDEDNEILCEFVLKSLIQVSGDSHTSKKLNLSFRRCISELEVGIYPNSEIPPTINENISTISGPLPKLWGAGNTAAVCPD